MTKERTSLCSWREGTVRSIFPIAQAESQYDDQNPEYDGVRADHPCDRHQSRNGPDRQCNAKQHGKQTAEHHKPLAFDLLPQTNGGDDLEDARYDCPGRNDGEQCKCSRARPKKCDQTHGNTHHTLQDKHPAPFALCTKGTDQRKNTIPQRVGSEEQYKDCESDIWPYKCPNTKEHSRYAAQDKCPPVLR